MIIRASNGNPFAVKGFTDLVEKFGELNEQQQNLVKLMAENGRWLIGICMALAVYWKVISPGYVDGTFFQFILNSDHRFHPSLLLQTS